MADVADNLVLESLSSLIGNGDIDSVNIDFKVDKSFLVNGNDMRSGALTIDASEIPFEKTAAAGTKASESIEWWFNNIALLRTTKENDLQEVDCKNIKFTSEVTEVNGAGFTINYPNAPINLTSTKLNITSIGFDIENSGRLEITNENGISIENKNGGFLLSNTGHFTINNTADTNGNGGIYLNTTGGKPVSITSGQFKHTFRSPDSSYTRYFASDGNLTVVSSNDPTRDPYYVTKAQLITYDENYIVSPTIPKTFGNGDGFIQQGILFSGNTGNAYAAIHHYFGASSSSDADSDIRKSQSSINFQLTVPFKKIYDVDESGNATKKLVKNWHGSDEPWTSNSNHIGAQLGIKYHPNGFKGTALEPDSNEPIGISTYCNIWPDDDYNSDNQIATNGWTNGRFELKEFRDEPGKFIDYINTTAWREDPNYRPLIYCKTQHTLTFKGGKTETVYAGYRGYRLSKVHTPIGISSVNVSNVADWEEYTEKGYYNSQYETVLYTSATVDNDTATNRILWANCPEYNRDYPRAGTSYSHVSSDFLRYGYGTGSIFLCEDFKNFEKILIITADDQADNIRVFNRFSKDLDAELAGYYFGITIGTTLDKRWIDMTDGFGNTAWYVAGYNKSLPDNDWKSTAERFVSPQNNSDYENCRMCMVVGINRLPNKTSKTLINDDIPSYA